MESKDDAPRTEEARLRARHFYLVGRVQGVGFRRYVEREALALGLTGWVRNTPDGRVEVLAAGPEDGLGRLAERLRQGPRGARVYEMSTENLESAPPTGRFHIRRDP
jgi:acylphosphatase